jgi:hypothetical protein
VTAGGNAAAVLMNKVAMQQQQQQQYSAGPSPQQQQQSSPSPSPSPLQLQHQQQQQQHHPTIKAEPIIKSPVTPQSPKLSNHHATSTTATLQQQLNITTTSTTTSTIKQQQPLTTTTITPSKIEEQQGSVPSNKSSEQPGSSSSMNETIGDNNMDLDATDKQRGAVATTSVSASAKPLPPNLEAIKNMKEEKFLNMTGLHRKLTEIGKKNNIIMKLLFFFL